MTCSFNYSKSIEIQFDSTGLNGVNIAKMRKVMQDNIETNLTSFLQSINVNPKSTQFT